MRASYLALIGLAALALPCTARASLLAVDFQVTGDTTQTGFSQFLATSTQPGPTTESFGSYNVTMTAQVDSLDTGGGDFDRGGLVNSGAFTYANLYNSFAFNNSTATFASSATTSISLVLSGAGIAANTPYLLTFYSFDSDAGRPATTGAHHFSAAGSSGTIGTSGTLVWSDTTPPTSNNQDSISQVYTSDGTGNLTFVISDTYTGNQDSRSGVRLNAIVLNTAPEPATFTLLGAALAAIGLVSWRRKRQVL